MLKKTIPMTVEHAVSIANDMLDVLQAFIEVHPFFSVKPISRKWSNKVYSHKI